MADIIPIESARAASLLRSLEKLELQGAAIIPITTPNGLRATERLASAIKAAVEVIGFRDAARVFTATMTVLEKSTRSRG